MTAPAPADGSTVATSASAVALQGVPASEAIRDDRMPRGIPFIVANEFAERFCYYGINAILTIYMTSFLRMGDAETTMFHSLFKAGAYFFPLLGAIVADALWGKYRTIITFSLVYSAGCAVVALVSGRFGLFLGLALVAIGTGGIKPCVSANVGDQFTSKNKHLIDRAFSYFYLSINAGSSISIYLCPVLLDPFREDASPKWLARYFAQHGIHGPTIAFGLPAIAMAAATLVFWSGRKRFSVVPPAGRGWLEETGLLWIWQKLRSGFGKATAPKEGLRTIGRIAVIYVFVGFFWSLWDQANGQTWTLQAESSLMDKELAFGFHLSPAQVQVVNGLLILAMVPIFTFGIYPLMGRFFKVTQLRKIGIGLFVIAISYTIPAWIEGRIQAGIVVSVWWQILAYVVLTASEILVSITALEFAYTQAPLRMKSFVMSVFLLSVWLGNLIVAGVNLGMTRPLHAESADVGATTWVKLSDVQDFVVGQKVDFAGSTGITVTGPDGKSAPLEGTFLVAAIDEPGRRLELMDRIERKPVVTKGALDVAKAKVSTYKLVGPQYFHFFALMMTFVAVVYIFVARRYKGTTHLRDEQPQTA
jgi:POT family proton-dependent oligopeptide transporter